MYLKLNKIQKICKISIIYVLEIEKIQKICKISIIYELEIEQNSKNMQNIYNLCTWNWTKFIKYAKYL